VDVAGLDVLDERAGLFFGEANPDQRGHGCGLDLGAVSLVGLALLARGLLGGLLLADIEKFNAVPIHEPLAITGKTLRSSIATRERISDRAENGVIVQNKRLNSCSTKRCRRGFTKLGGPRYNRPSPNPAQDVRLNL
jgi:hypothetical protein